MSDSPHPFGTVSCEACGAETPVTYDGKTNGPENCPGCGAPLWENPCPDGEHCCCCGPGEKCCDCGEIMPEEDAAILAKRLKREAGLE
jgi:hypothetical protein